MPKEVIIKLSASQEVHLQPGSALTQQDARQWLDQQFVELECEPLRASGKVLTADKVLAIANTATREQLESPQWSSAFASAITAALGKDTVLVDLPAGSISF
ncbi:hypothetical protein AAV94_00615 [Lampropedia cohaerens]|uniref:Uncharacterized protein n=1 Tax=Lampropedia cohaerens TaxID=1610491 RepID=A0A0U1Q3C6_9BURK|nr:hypothetical protein [Lampropedia cohaerens]KKW69268.1 hypothetical protein AAV94_00615 [Lampropedia cohaerens]